MGSTGSKKRRSGVNTVFSLTGPEIDSQTSHVDRDFLNQHTNRPEAVLLNTVKAQGFIKLTAKGKNARRTTVSVIKAFNLTVELLRTKKQKYGLVTINAKSD